MTITSMELANLRGLIKFAYPLPWHWATSNSTARLSSASGKDGDVVSAFRATDGVPCVNVSSDNMNLIASAVNYLPELLAHIDAQAARIAEQQAVIDQRNGECDRLIHELAALRANIKTAESYPDDADLKFTIDWYDDERSDGLQMAMWLKELRRRREQPAPVAVPSVIGIHDMDAESKDIEVVTAIAQCEGWNACRAEVLRLNSGSKQFVVTMPKSYLADKNGNSEDLAPSWDSVVSVDEVTEAIKAAGGEIAE